MGSLLKASSTIGRKLVMGITGLGLVVFVVFHLLENLQLYAGGARFNGYVAWLHSFGPWLTVAEIGLALLILIHAILAIWVSKSNYAARGPVRYSVWKSKGDPSHASLSSRHMIVTGVVLLAFLVLHIWQFRFGPGNDLYRLVADTFHNSLFVGIYVAVMLFLGLHLRHGFWSAFQSLGAMNPRFSRPVYFLGLVIGIVVAAGFLAIPLWFYFGGAA